MVRILIIVISLFYVASASAEELTDEKKALIDELLIMSGATNIAEQMANGVVQSMINSMAQSSPEIDPRIPAILKEEIGLLFKAEFVDNGWIFEAYYPIYHQHFTSSELQEMIEYNKTPLAQKIIRVMPEIMQAGMIAGQSHARSLQSLLQQRVMARLEKEGFISKDAAPK